ncbi:MAG: DUF1489 family protein [bacterium]
MTLHLIKLCVGAESIEDLIDWRGRSLQERQQQNLSAHMYHITRMWPRREQELLQGGSIYWVIKGLIQARQPLAGFEEVIGKDGIRRCCILMEPEFIPTIQMPKRPFQGWRYLKASDAPDDLPHGQTAIPPALALQLSELGLM